MVDDSTLEPVLATLIAFVANSAQGGQNMKTIRRLIHGEIIRAVSFVAIGFLALFVFFDLVDQLQVLSRNKYQGYQFQHALMYVGLLIPSHLYELLPISVLIGSIFVMARFAQSSEFTILRTSGLGPVIALRTLLAETASRARVTWEMFFTLRIRIRISRAEAMQIHPVY